MLIQASWPWGSETHYGEKLSDIKKKYKTDDSVMFKVYEGEIRRINKAGGICG
jgi:hypothetical protein